METKTYELKVANAPLVGGMKPLLVAIALLPAMIAGNAMVFALESLNNGFSFNPCGGLRIHENTHPKSTIDSRSHPV